MSESPIRRLIRNASVLLSGGVIGAGLAFLSTLIAARYLGAEALGVIVLVQSTVLVVDKLVNFQSWSTVIKFGADALESGDRRAYERVLKYGTLLDAFSALASGLIAVVATYVVSAKFGWAPEIRRLGVIYSLFNILNFTGTPTAVLRMHDRYGVFVWQRLIGGGTKTLGVCLAWLLDAGMAGVLAAWIIGDVTTRMALTIPGWWEVKRRGYGEFYRVSMQGLLTAHPGIVKFSLVANITTSVRLASNQLDDFLVAILLSPDLVGLYKIAKQFGALVTLANDPLRHVVYPDLAKQVAAKDRAGFVRYLIYGTRLAAAIAVPYWLLFVVAGKWVLALTVGPEFMPAAGVLVAYTGAAALGLLFFIFSPAMMALGKPQANLAAIGAATVVYFVAFPPLVRVFGLEGAGFAYCVFYGVWATLMAVFVAKEMGRWPKDTAGDR